MCYNKHTKYLHRLEDTSMDENVNKRNEVLAQTVINGLQSRNMSGYYAEDKEAALKQALELIDEESTIAMGGCHMTPWPAPTRAWCFWSRPHRPTSCWPP